MKRLQFCLAVFAVLALTFSAFAQVQNGQFDGAVTDPTGAAIANAKVTVTNPATDLNLTTTTNSSGNYTVKEVPVGTHKLTVEAAGFKPVSNAGVTANAGTIAHVDFKMQLGRASEVIEVTGEAAAVNTEDAKLATTVNAAQINNLPLNGRNVFDLMQISPGAVNVAGTDFENGHNTVVNGVREDFNGFLINGVSNKGLSGGAVNVPIQDTVEEFQQLGLNMSAQYGNSAGGTVNLVTKAGTNAFHGTVWEYIRNNAADANDYFFNQFNAQQKATGGPTASQPPLRWNQFGFTIGGPIIKDKLFFFGYFQGSRFNYSNVSTVTEESQQWRDAIKAADQATGVNSVANVLYQNFPPKVGGATLFTPDQYFANVTSADTGLSNYADYLCPDTYGPAGFSLPAGQINVMVARMQSLLGVVPAVDNVTPLSFTGAPCSTPLVGQLGFIGRDLVTGISSMPFQVSGISLVKSQTGAFGNVGNLFNGNEASLRVDFDPSQANRFSVNFNYSRTTDKYGPCGDPACARGFFNPEVIRSPNGQFSFLHTFSPKILNEFRA